MKVLTIGEIYRLHLLLDENGRPYAHKANVSRRIKASGLAVTRPTKWGLAQTVTRRQIDAMNKKIKKA